MSDYDPNFKPIKHFFLVGQKAVLVHDDQILVLKRSVKAGGGGKWSLPGGALESGEDPYQSISREIYEETGLRVSNLRPFHIKAYQYDQDQIVIIGYVARVQSTQIKLNWEHDEHRWLSGSQALKLDLTADGRTFIEAYLNHDPGSLSLNPRDNDPGS